MVDTASPWSASPAIGKLHIDAAPPHSSGIDPALLAIGNQGMFGGANGLLPLLIGAFLFGGRGGLFGGNGVNAGAGAFAAEAVAAQSIFTPKDTSLQLNSFQNWAQNNATQLATGIAGIDKSICCSSRDIIAAVSALTPQMFQQFAAQAMQSCQQTAGINDNINRGFTGLHDEVITAIGQTNSSVAAGFAAGALAECQTQNLVNATSADVNFKTASGFQALAAQLAACCCDNRLAVANQTALIERNTAQINAQSAAQFASLTNQLNMQTCEIKQAIAADGQATRALIQANTVSDLQAQLNDAKSAVRDAQIIAALRPPYCCGPVAGPLPGPVPSLPAR